MHADECAHPFEEQELDQTRGETVCKLCGTVISRGTYHQDPNYANRDGGGAAGGGGGMRGAGPGFARPPRAQRAAHGSHGANRPSIEAARRQMAALAKKMGLPFVVVDTATVMYRQAVNANAIVGARMSVICACLYLVCRKSRLPQTVIDFSEQTQEPPWAILNYVRAICRVTHLEVPPADPSFYVARFAEALNLGEFTMDVALYALKVLHAMKDDWISAGRRPLGICAAAVLVACRMYGIERSADDFQKLAKVTWNTIIFHVEEFAQTPAAALESIDEYQPSNVSVPHSYSQGRSKDVERKTEELARFAEADYYSLIDAAKANAPITPERMEIWRRFALQRSKLFKIELDESILDIRKLTLKEQFDFLGIPYHHQLMSERFGSQAGTSNSSLARSQQPIRNQVPSRHQSEGRSSTVSANHQNHPNNNSLREEDFEKIIPTLTPLASQIPTDIQLSQDDSAPDANISKVVSTEQISEARKIAQGLQLSLAASPLVQNLELHDPHFDYRHASQRTGASSSQVSSHHDQSGGTSLSLTQNALSSSQHRGTSPTPHHEFLMSSSQKDQQDNFLQSSQQFGNNNNLMNNSAVSAQQQALAQKLGFFGLNVRNRLTQLQLQLLNAPSVRGDVIRLDVDDGDSDTEEYMITDGEEMIRKEKNIKTILQTRFNALNEEYVREVRRYEGRSDDLLLVTGQTTNNGNNNINSGNNTSGGNNNHLVYADDDLLLGGPSSGNNNNMMMMDSNNNNNMMMFGNNNDTEDEDVPLWQKYGAGSEANNNNNNNQQQQAPQKPGGKKTRQTRRDTQLEHATPSSAVAHELKRKGGMSHIDQSGLKHLLQEDNAKKHNINNNNNNNDDDDFNL